MHAEDGTNANARAPPAQRRAMRPPGTRCHAGDPVASANPRGRALSSNNPRAPCSTGRGPAGETSRSGPFRVCAIGSRQQHQISEEVIINMKVVKNNDNNKPLTVAEMEACRQFEESQREGQAVFHPAVGAGRPAPNCTAFLKKIGRFAVTILEGRYAVEDGRWYRCQANDVQVPVNNPLEAAWQAVRSVRIALEPELGFQPYVIAVLWFPEMEEDEDILDEADGRSVRLLFGQVDLVPILADLPREEELQTQLSRRYIEREMAALCRASAALAPEPAETSSAVKGRAGALVIERVETVNIYVTVASGGADDDPPLITVQGQ